MRGMCRNVRAGEGVSGVGKFISSKVLRPWNFAKNDHKNVKLASLRQCHFYAQRKIPEPKYFHEPLQASPSRIHPPRLQPFPQTHSPTLENECSLTAPLHKHLQSFHISLSLSHVFQRGRQGGVRGGTAAFATVSEFPLGWFSYLPNIKKRHPSKGYLFCHLFRRI